MGGDQVQMLQAKALLHLLQGNCWWRGSSSAAIIVGLQCRQGNPLQQVKRWNCCIILTGQESGDQGRSGLRVAHDTRTVGDFLGFLMPPHQSVVEAKRSPLMIIHSLWPSDHFNLIKSSSCCRARRTRSYAELQVCTGSPTSRVMLAQKKAQPSQPGGLVERKS